MNSRNYKVPHYVICCNFLLVPLYLSKWLNQRVSSNILYLFLTLYEITKFYTHIKQHVKLEPEKLKMKLRGTPGRGCGVINTYV